MSYYTPKPSLKQRGRPKGSGHLKPPEEKSTLPAKISPELHALALSERLFNESISDTILRLLRQKSNAYIDMRKKYDALLERHNNLHLVVNNSSS